jgi:hypothetical protein
MAKKKQRRSAFVPRLLVPAAAAMSVVPVCALASCSGNVSTPGSGAQGTTSQFSVAAVAYPAYEAGTGGGSTTSSSSTSSSTTTSSSGFTVAAVAYPAYEAGAG